MNKQCFKCRETKALSEFYKHQMMRDGHLNKCITCAKRDVNERERRLRQHDPHWLSKERARCREKQARSRANGTASPTKPEYRERWVQKNGHKVRAEHIAANALKKGRLTKPSLCQCCGAAPKRMEMHHPDYSKPLEVLFLCSKCHGKAHRKP